MNQKEIAHLLGVNQTTVSRALRGSPRISEEMRAKVLELCQRLGYEPDYMATGLASGETRLISAIKWNRLPSDLHGQWLDRLENAAHARGYSFRLDRMDDVRKLAGGRSADGFIIFGRWDKAYPATMAYVYQTKRPVVYIDCATDDIPSSAVAIDNRGGVEEAVRHLLGLGHRYIAFFGLIGHHGVCRERHQGYVSALNESGLPAPGILTILHNDWPVEPDDVLPHADELISAVDGGVTAVIASSDIGAVGAYKILKRKGYDIPRDISIIGFDDTLLARAFEPPLTTVRQDIPVAAEIAIERVVGLIHGHPDTPGVVVPAPLVVRATTGPAPPTLSREVRD